MQDGNNRALPVIGTATNSHVGNLESANDGLSAVDSRWVLTHPDPRLDDVDDNFAFGIDYSHLDQLLPEIDNVDMESSSPGASPFRTSLGMDVASLAPFRPSASNSLLPAIQGPRQEASQSPMQISQITAKGAQSLNPWRLQHPNNGSVPFTSTAIASVVDYDFVSVPHVDLSSPVLPGRAVEELDSINLGGFAGNKQRALQFVAENPSEAQKFRRQDSTTFGATTTTQQQRRPFQDVKLREETGRTRKDKACMRCRLQKVRVCLTHFSTQ